MHFTATSLSFRLNLVQPRHSIILQTVVNLKYEIGHMLLICF